VQQRLGHTNHTFIGFSNIITDQTSFYGMFKRRCLTLDSRIQILDM
jgi:hypothetical protein